MKKLFVILLGTLLICSCNKDAEKKSCLPPATVTKIYLETEHGKQGFDFHVFESERSMGYYASISLIPENTYRGILKAMLPQLTDETVSISMVVNGSANQKSFKKEDIIGFVSVGVENKRYRMKAYTIEDGSYILDPIMDIRTVAIRTSFENIIRNRAYESYPNTNIHIVTLNKKNQTSIEIDKSLPDEFYVIKRKMKEL